MSQAEACATCPARASHLVQMGLNVKGSDFVVALAGNPNTGKSTVFNALTGLRQHTGNWPGKTVVRAEGAFVLNEKRYKLVDLPGTYSLLSASYDEEVARDFVLFGQPDVTVVVVDASHLERNLNLTLQVLEITDRVVVCLNLVDEAKRRGLTIDARRLARDLGVPVVPVVARRGEGMDVLNDAIAGVAEGRIVCRPRRRNHPPEIVQSALEQLMPHVEALYPKLPNVQWVALRLLEGDARITDALLSGELGHLGQHQALLPTTPHDLGDDEVQSEKRASDAGGVLRKLSELRWQLGPNYYQSLIELTYEDAAALANRALISDGSEPRFDWERAVDRIVTSRRWGILIMIGLLTLVFWITISGANWPSAALAWILLDVVHPSLSAGATLLGFPWWLKGLLIDGMYLGTAWVVAVMLPPMAIFFPLFTLLEDLGYLPRVAFNLDRAFKRVGGQGKQALTMTMGFGCNAAAIVSTRIIRSPRERLIAILTNNFALCNGRWPTQILVASIFVGALVPAYFAGLVSALAVVAVALTGVLLTFATSWMLSRTVLRGEPSVFSLELPPYRPPQILRTLYTSLIDRTLLVLWRAVVFALPAGALIWLVANIQVAGLSIAEQVVNTLEPFGVAIGLSGVILLAYIIAIPANEIVIPTILMLTVLVTRISGVGAGTGVMFELDSAAATGKLLEAGGWTLLTGVNLMLFSLIHNPCSTTIYTIWKETRSAKWTAIASVGPLLLGFAVCFALAQAWRFLGLP